MKRFPLFVMVFTLGGVSPLRAQEPEPPPKKWKDTAEVSVVSTNGNSKATTTSVKNLYRYEWSKETALELDGQALGAQSDGSVKAENYKASEKYTLGFMDRTYAYEKFTWDSDRFAGIRNRYDGSVGLGRLIWVSPKNKLNGELGGGYINEEFTEAPRDDYASGRAYSKYEHVISSTARLTQDAEYIHNFDNSKAYRLNTESAVIASMTTHLSLKVSFRWKRSAIPPPGAVKDDTVTAAALIINY